MTTLDEAMVMPGFTKEQLSYFRRMGAKSKGHKGRLLTSDQARAAVACRKDRTRKAAQAQ